MDDEEMKRMINAAGFIGAILGFFSGAVLMALAFVIF
jgi:tetrahydromethanopterin S-methyltransferase subunit F